MSAVPPPPSGGSSGSSSELQFPLLSRMSTAELLRAVAEPEAYEALLAAAAPAALAPALAQVRSARARNGALASDVMAEREAGRDALNAARVARGAALQPALSRVQALAARQAALVGALSPQALVARLREAAQQAASAAEGALEEARAARGDAERLDAALQRYVDLRALSHEREATWRAAEASIPPHAI